MRFHSIDKVRLVIPKAALTTIFDECDGFEQDETGGRVVGTYHEQDDKLDIHVTGIIEPGPQARRSAVSFFQDGEYQEQVFRKIEDQHRDIEHLGNWHTHHVNGLSHLSDGDIATYHRNVNHHNHNTSFFYALLVTAKHRSSDPLRRYSVKHYLLRRGDERVYELHGRQVEIVDAPLVWPVDGEQHHHGHMNPAGHDLAANPAPPLVWPAGVGHRHHKRGSHSGRDLGANSDRAYDNDILSDFFPGVRPFSNAKLGMYWRGPLELLDGSKVEVVLLRDADASNPVYTVTLREPPATLKDLAEELATIEFSSARSALITAERSCNRALYLHHGGKRRVDVSI
jgi:hypothetical protein